MRNRMSLERMCAIQHILPFIMLLVFTFSAGEAARPAISAEIGTIAPSFELADLNGNRVSLSDYKGKVVLLNFWATYCIPCKEEMPSLQNLYLALMKDGFVVLAVTRDDSEKDVRSFIKGREFTFPVLLDKDQEVSFDQYGISFIPASFIIDRNGIIRDKIIGERTWDARDMKDKFLVWLSKNREDGK